MRRPFRLAEITKLQISNELYSCKNKPTYSKSVGNTAELNRLDIWLQIYFKCNLNVKQKNDKPASWSKVIGAGSGVPGGAQAPPELFLAPPEPFEPPLTIKKIMHWVRRD